MVGNSETALVDSLPGATAEKATRAGNPKKYLWGDFSEIGLIRSIIGGDPKSSSQKRVRDTRSIVSVRGNHID
jgi:hypothetical protein